jgi:hypothetical protein
VPGLLIGGSRFGSEAQGKKTGAVHLIDNDSIGVAQTIGNDASPLIIYQHDKTIVNIGAVSQRSWSTNGRTAISAEIAFIAFRNTSSIT